MHVVIDAPKPLCFIATTQESLKSIKELHGSTGVPVALGTLNCLFRESGGERTEDSLNAGVRAVPSYATV